MTVRHYFTRILRDDAGAASVEYGILVAAVAAGIIVAAFSIGAVVANAFNFVSSTLNSQCKSPCGN